MSDLVDRLRQTSFLGVHTIIGKSKLTHEVPRISLEAADEIERLQVELMEAQKEAITSGLKARGLRRSMRQNRPVYVDHFQQ